MKNTVLLIALAIILAAPRLAAQAPSFGPGFQDPIYGGYAHAFGQKSILVKSEVDLGDASFLGRVVKVRYGTIGGYQAIDSLQYQITSSGTDEFQINVGSVALWWYVELHYVDEDGVDIPGSPAYLGPIDVMPEIDFEVDHYEVNDATNELEVNVTCSRHLVGNNYITRFVCDVDNVDFPGATAPYQELVVGTGGGQMTYDHDFYIGFMPAGQLCAHFQIWVEHQGPGYSDFPNTLVGETELNYCDYWEGVSTGISDLAWSHFTVEAGNITVASMNGQAVFQGSVSSTKSFDTSTWANGAYNVVRVNPQGRMFSKKIVVSH